MNDSTKVSIIIPIYNVETYLRQCVESVCNQTYRDLQIILVNDGSTDQSGEICKELAKKDHRIEVIHKENGGLSDARNTGIVHAAGAFVFYLDSDDYLEPDAIEVLLKIQQSSDAEVVAGNYFYTYSEYEEVANSVYDKETFLENRAAMEALVTGKIQNFAWGKLIKRELATKYLFPKGKLFEDNYWAHLVFGDALKAAVTNQPLVHYRQRENSISYTFNIKRLDILEGWLVRKEYLEKSYPELLDDYLRHLSGNYINIAWLVLTKMKENKKEAFAKLRSCNEQLQLQNYSTGITKKLICKLDHSDLAYAVGALSNRLLRG